MRLQLQLNLDIAIDKDKLQYLIEAAQKEKNYEAVLTLEVILADALQDAGELKENKLQTLQNVLGRYQDKEVEAAIKIASVYIEEGEKINEEGLEFLSTLLKNAPSSEIKKTCRDLLLTSLISNKQANLFIDFINRLKNPDPILGELANDCYDYDLLKNDSSLKESTSLFLIEIINTCSNKNLRSDKFTQERIVNHFLLYGAPDASVIEALVGENSNFNVNAVIAVSKNKTRRWLSAFDIILESGYIDDELLQKFEQHGAKLLPVERFKNQTLKKANISLRFFEIYCGRKKQQELLGMHASQLMGVEPPFEDLPKDMLLYVLKNAAYCGITPCVSEIKNQYKNQYKNQQDVEIVLLQLLKEVLSGVAVDLGEDSSTRIKANILSVINNLLQNNKFDVKAMTDSKDTILTLAPEILDVKTLKGLLENGNHFAVYTDPNDPTLAECKANVDKFVSLMENEAISDEYKDVLVENIDSLLGLERAGDEMAIDKKGKKIGVEQRIFNSGMEVRAKWRCNEVVNRHVKKNESSSKIECEGSQDGAVLLSPLPRRPSQESQESDHPML
jgi:hypothetical protein